MSVVPMKNSRMYWENETRYDQIADKMSRNRFETIKCSFHVAYTNDLFEKNTAE